MFDELGAFFGGHMSAGGSEWPQIAEIGAKDRLSAPYVRTVLIVQGGIYQRQCCVTDVVVTMIVVQGIGIIIGALVSVMNHRSRIGRIKHAVEKGRQQAIKLCALQGIFAFRRIGLSENVRKTRIQKESMNREAGKLLLQTADELRSALTHDLLELGEVLLLGVWLLRIVWLRPVTPRIPTSIGFEVEAHTLAATFPRRTPAHSYVTQHPSVRAPVLLAEPVHSRRGVHHHEIVCELVPFDLAHRRHLRGECLLIRFFGLKDLVTAADMHQYAVERILFHLADVLHCVRRRRPAKTEFNQLLGLFLPPGRDGVVPPIHPSVPPVVLKQLFRHCH